jgi:hypothetical protein
MCFVICMCPKDFGEIQYIGHIIILSFMKIAYVRAKLYLKAHWNFHPKFPRLDSCFGADWYHRPASNAIDNFLVSLKSSSGRPFF